MLLAALRDLDHAERSTREMERFLYRHFPPPQSAAWWKISPGEQASLWEQCRANGYVCVGWPAMGDLREYASKDEYKRAFEQAYEDLYNHQPHIVSRKANEFWRLMELRPGDRIVANQGKSKILAVGTVREPVYGFDSALGDFPNLIYVDWDERYARDIATQGAWLNTIDRVTSEQRKLIDSGVGPATRAESEPDEPPVLYLRLEEALAHKRQAVLYGPPGTGKTFHALRFAAWWLARRNGEERPAMLLSDPDAWAAAMTRYGGRSLARNAWLVVVNPNQWPWQELFHLGSKDFHAGRLQRNLPLVQPGDLVIFYESRPTKRLVALAKVSRPYAPAAAGAPPTFGIVPVHQIADGLTYEELTADEELAQSEPLRHRFQGTIFRLAPEEAERMLTRLAERDRDVLQHAEHEEEVGQYTLTTFHPSYGYEDFVEGYRPVPASGGELILRWKTASSSACAERPIRSRAPVPPGHRRDQPRKRRQGLRRAHDPHRGRQARDRRHAAPEQGAFPRPGEPHDHRHDEHG